MSIIKTKNLTKIYKKGRKKIRALHNLNLSVDEGTIFGFLGRNGAGKTTAIKLFLGLLRPTSGNISILGKNPDNIDIKNQIGYLPEISYLDKDFTAWELLKFFGNFFKIERKVVEERIDDLLSQFGLLTFKDTKIGDFSKGMLQKIAIIQALLHQPKLLILDEPTEGLDPISQHEIREFVKNEKKKGNTIFLSSHYLDEVEELCDVIGVLHKGKLLRYGEKDKLLQYKIMYTFIIKGKSIESIVSKYNGKPFLNDCYKLHISLNEKENFTNLLNRNKIEIVEFYREREEIADFFLRTIGESKNE